MSLTTTDSATEPRSFSVGPLKMQPLSWTSGGGETTATITASQLPHITNISAPGLELTAAPTFSGNTATLAFTALPVVTPAVDASVTLQGATFTAVASGTAGNGITIEYIDPGPESVSVTGGGTILTIHLDPGVSTASSIVTLVNNDGIASLYVIASGSGATPLIPEGPTPTAGGVDAIGPVGDILCFGY